MNTSSENACVKIKCIEVTQPLGSFYLGSIPYKKLIELTYSDQRRLAGEKDFENYLGIQRPLNQSRVREIRKYVETEDACFPTAIILAVPGICASFDSEKSTLTLSPYTKVNTDDENENIELSEIAKILDGQHRIAGLKDANLTKDFEINVSIFVDMDIADQAYLFSTVNLAQTKVNKSLVYDLFDLAKTRSPQKSCHNIALVLDKEPSSPLFQMIKRLGVSTDGKFNESIAQATFVESLLKYISKDPLDDRNEYLKGNVPNSANGKDLKILIFRNLFINNKDIEITDIIWNYFEAIKKKWNVAWTTFKPGNILNRTNGFKALMRFLRPVYLKIGKTDNVPTTFDFFNIISTIDLKDEDFKSETYLPGASGEGLLFRTLMATSELDKDENEQTIKKM